MAQRSITFPQEIYDIILAFLAQDDDLATLKAAALTCKAILPTCRSHIFATLYLLPHSGRTSSGVCDNVADALSRKLGNLKSVFDSNPGLQFHVREVHYMIRLADDKPQEFHSVLQTLTRVRVLILKGTIHSTGPYQVAGTVNWPSLSTSLHTALKSIMHSCCFRELSLDHINDFPIDLIIGSKNLTRLTVDNADFQDAGPTADTGPVHLTSLTFMDYSSRSIRSLIEVPAVDFTRLRKLNSFDKTAKVVVSSLLDQSKCLESMTVTVWDSFNKPFRDILKPHTLDTLTSFAAVILIPPWLGEIDLDPYYSLSDEFDKWASKNVLEQIKVKIDVSQDVKLPMAPDAWMGLNTLAIRHRFSKLRSVSLKINLMWDDTSAQEIKDMLERERSDIFKALLENDEIAFQFSVELFATYA